VTDDARLGVAFAGGRDFYSPGDEVAGTVQWDLPAPPEWGIEVRLLWSTRGRGDRDFNVVARQVVPSPAARGSYQFRLQLPLAPYSFSGQLVSLIWAVEVLAVSEELAGHAELVMGPGGCEARIDGGGLEPPAAG
jgi:hypothetical protein